MRRDSKICSWIVQPRSQKKPHHLPAKPNKKANEDNLVDPANNTEVMNLEEEVDSLLEQETNPTAETDMSLT